MHFTAFDAYAELPALPQLPSPRSSTPDVAFLVILTALWCVAAINTACAALMLMGVL